MVDTEAFEMDDEQARRSRLLLRDEWSGLSPPRDSRRAIELDDDQQS